MSVPARLAQAVGAWAGPSLLSFGPGSPTISCDIAWMDSFHYMNRITLEMPTPESLVLRMFNVTPDGQEAWAVEASYRRR